MKKKAEGKKQKAERGRQKAEGRRHEEGAVPESAKRTDGNSPPIYRWEM